MRISSFDSLTLTICFIAIYSTALTEAGNVEDYLKNLESTGYDKNEPPEPIQLRQEFIELHFGYNRIQDLDDISGQFSSQMLIMQEWQDVRLRYNRTHRLDWYKLIPRKQLWQPQINIFNEVRKKERLLGKTTLMVSAWGHVIDVSQLVTHVSCIPNLRKFPFDTQECSIKVGFATYLDDDIDIRADVINPFEKMDLIDDNPRWKIHGIHMDHSKEMIQSANGYSLKRAAVFSVKMDRKASLLALGLFTTLTCAVSVALTSFSIADSLRPRLFLSISSAIVMIMLITTISRIIPVNRYGMPIIVTYATIFFGFAILTLFSAILHGIMRSLDIAVPSMLAGFFERLPQAVLKIIVLPVSTSKVYPLTSDGKESLNTGSGEASNDSEHATREMTTLSQGTCVPGSPPCSPNLRQWAIMVKVFDGLYFWIYLIASIGLFISMAQAFQQVTEC